MHERKERIKHMAPKTRCGHLDKISNFLQALAAFDHAYAKREEVALFLDTLCKALVGDMKSFHRMLLHDLGGPMLLEAAQGGLPYPNAVRVRAPFPLFLSP